MATRWGAPCGCISMYDIIDGEAVMIAHERKCVLHEDVTLNNLMATLKQYCIDLQAQNGGG